uniref:Uncharacterized protein n=1 Tax=Glossina palpalis gambiensis TaxID=67801 RepID=A0A1B0C328_9MUSC
MGLGSRDKAERVTFLKQLIHMNERNSSHAFFRPTFNKHISEKERKMHVGVVTTPVVFNVRHLVVVIRLHCHCRCAITELMGLPSDGLRQFSDKLDAREHEEHDLSRLTFFEKRKTPSAHRALMNIGSIESLDVVKLFAGFFKQNHSLKNISPNYFYKILQPCFKNCYTQTGRT